MVGQSSVLLRSGSDMSLRKLSLVLPIFLAGCFAEYPDKDSATQQLDAIFDTITPGRQFVLASVDEVNCQETPSDSDADRHYCALKIQIKKTADAAAVSEEVYLSVDPEDGSLSRDYPFDFELEYAVLDYFGPEGPGRTSLALLNAEVAIADGYRSDPEKQDDGSFKWATQVSLRIDRGKTQETYVYGQFTRGDSGWVFKPSDIEEFTERRWTGVKAHYDEVRFHFGGGSSTQEFGYVQVDPNDITDGHLNGTQTIEYTFSSNSGNNEKPGSFKVVAHMEWCNGFANCATRRLAEMSGCDISFVQPFALRIRSCRDLDGIYLPN